MRIILKVSVGYVLFTHCIGTQDIGDFTPTHGYQMTRYYAYLYVNVDFFM